MKHDTDENGIDTGLTGAWNTLSAAGRSRCDAMLPVLQSAVVREGLRRRRRRSMVRAAGAMALLLAVAVGLRYVPWPSESPMRVTQDGAPDSREDVLAEKESQSKWRVTIIETAPGALDRHIIDPIADPAEYIVDDRELVATLAAIGRPAGLIRLGESIRLTAAVTDAELKRDLGPSVAPATSPPAQGDRHPI